MAQNLYSDSKLSLIRFVKNLGLSMTPAVTEFVDLDSHAELDKLPKKDFLGLMGFSIQMDDKQFTVFCSVVCSVWADPDLMRLTKMMNTTFNALMPEKQVPLWDGNSFSRWLVVGHDASVEPTDTTDQRAIQVCTVRLLSIRA